MKLKYWNHDKALTYFKLNVVYESCEACSLCFLNTAIEILKNLKSIYHNCQGNTWLRNNRNVQMLLYT